MTQEELKELLNKVNSKLAVVQALEEKSKTTGEAVEGFERRFDELKEDVKKLAGALQGSAVSIPGLEDEKREFSFQAAFRGILGEKHGRDDWGDGFEKEVLKEANKQRDIVDTSTGGAGGGYAIPVEMLGPIIPALVQRQVLNRLGASQVMVPSNVGKLEMPFQSATSVATWIGEHAALTESNAEFGQFALTPHRVGHFTRVSKRFLSNAVVGAEALIREDLFGALARAIDLAAFMGSGASNQPYGLISMIGTSTGGRDVGNVVLGDGSNAGKLMDLSDIPSFEAVLEDANAMRDGAPLSFVAHPRIWRHIKKERIPQWAYHDGTDDQVDPKGAYVMLPMTNQMLRDHMGYGFEKMTTLPTDLDVGDTEDVATPVFFGDWAQFLYSIWQTLIIDATDQASSASAGSAWLQNQVWIKAEGEVDFNVRYGRSFAVAQDALTPTA